MDIALRGNRVRVLPASAHRIFVKWSTHNLVLYVFVFKDILLNIYCCFINFGVIVNSTIVHAWVNPKICFLHKAYHILLVLRVITLHREPFFNLKKKKKGRSWPVAIAKKLGKGILTRFGLKWFEYDIFPLLREGLQPQISTFFHGNLPRSHKQGWYPQNQTSFSLIWHYLYSFWMIHSKY